MAALASAWAQQEPGEISLAGQPGSWPVGKPVPIAVAGGNVCCDVPIPAGSSALVIVSSLAKGAGPFPIRLSAESTQQVSPPPLADDGPSRRPEKVAPDSTPLDPPSNANPPSQRTFWLMARDGDVASPSNYLPVRGLLRAAGKRVQVYVDLADSGSVADDLVLDVVSTFDERVFPTAARQLGVASDVDDDGRFTVLLTGWLARLGGGRLAVDGFVRGADLDPDLGAPFGNRCDMMYLNARLTPGPHLRTVLAHEYTHAVSASQKAFGGPDGNRWGPEEEGWLDEAIAHLVEDLHGFSRSNIDYRISAYLSCPERYRLLVDDYYTSDLFRSHGNRGSTYLFLRWCADRFGPELVGTLVRSPLRGVANLEAATGMPFAALYRQWSVAVATSGLIDSQETAAPVRSVAPRSEPAGWALAGPRMRHIVADGADDVWMATGTSSHFSRVAASSSGALRITVSGPPSAELQVTVVPLGPDLGLLELAVHANRSPDGGVNARARIQERAGRALEIETLAWEPLVPCAETRPGTLKRGQLQKNELAACFGTTKLPALGLLDSQTFPIAGIAPADGPLIVKVVATDSQGHRLTAWAEVIVGPESRAAEQGSGPSRILQAAERSGTGRE